MGTLFTHPDGHGFYGIFNDSFPPILDGVTLAVENYVKWLDAKGHRTCVVTPWNPVAPPDEYKPIMRYFSLPIWNRHPYRYGYPKLDPFIWKRLRHTNFSLVHAHCPFSSGRLGIYVKEKQNIPLIGTFHSKYKSDLEHSFINMPWLVPVIMKRILEFFNACDEVWIPQAHVEETVREYGYRGPLTVVENGNDFVSLVSSDNLLSAKRQARKQIGIDDDELALLFVGQHIWEKGIDTIIDTLKILSAHHIKFRMNFIGTGYAVDSIRDKIKEFGLSDMVCLRGVIGDRNELSKFYLGSDLFLFPSLYDNAPLVVREAAAMGTPAILTAGSTASEVITDGVNGFLSEHSAEKFATVAEYLQQHPDKILKAAFGARQTLTRSWKDVVDEVADRYSSLIHRKKSALHLES